MIPLSELPGPPSNALNVLLGVAVVALVAGWALTRWQRDRLRFGLMRTALEKGVTRFPGVPPYWLVSLRQGVTLLALGLGLGIAGSAAWWLARGVEMPATPQAPTTQPAQGQPAQQSRSREDDEGPGYYRPGPPPDRNPDGPPPERSQGGPHHGPPDDPLGLGPPHQGPPHQGPPPHGPLQHAPLPQADPERGRQPRPEPFDPARERWHRAEAQQTIGLVTLAAGFILVILGIVRIAFAKVERQFASESEENTLY